MGKGKRQRERRRKAEVRHLRAVPDGQHELGIQHPAQLSGPKVGKPLEERPEYIAQMKAWREAGCP